MFTDSRTCADGSGTWRQRMDSRRTSHRRMATDISLQLSAAWNAPSLELSRGLQSRRKVTSFPMKVLLTEVKLVAVAPVGAMPATATAPPKLLPTLPLK